MKKFLALFILVFSSAVFAQSDPQTKVPDDLDKYLDQFVKKPGMQFYWGGDPGDPNDRSDVFLYLSGEIRTGDYQRFRTFMRENLEKYKKSSRMVILDSNGGNVAEALKIAELLRSMHVFTQVVNSKCAKACFYLYLSGDLRQVDHTNGRLGIHRAYFDQTYFGGLSPEEAQKRYSELTGTIKQFLNLNGVPQYLIEQMNGASSTDIYWLTFDDTRKLGWRQPWYEEMLIAKCGLDIPLEKRYMSLPVDSP